MNLKKTLLIGFIALLLFLIFIFIKNNSLKKIAKIKINNHVFKVEIASSPRTQSKGLSNRISLKEDEGMLFVYSDKNFYAFWMKDMQFPLDFVWIDNDTVVDITKSVPFYATGEIPTYTGRQPYDKVLEINAGMTDKYGINIGDRVIY